MKPLILFFALIAAATPQAVRFYVTRQWKYANFTWPDEDSYRTSTAKGHYIPENVIIAGVEYHEDYYYLTLPRMKAGVPATLARVKAGPAHDPSPNLEPFPSWEMNSVEDCDNLQNVQNVEIDAKGQMWIIDAGRVQTWVEPVVKCSPKLVVYDIEGMRMTTIYHFPEDVAGKNGSYLYDLVVDNTDGGYAYITDNGVGDPGIIVYSVKENRSWKIRDNRTMTADPSATHFNVNQTPVSVPINVAGIALGPKIHTSNEKVVVNEDREVYFSPMSSLHLYSINTTVLRNENLATKRANYDSIIKDLGVKGSQSAGMIMDNQGILYFGLLSDSAIVRWDSHTPFTSGQKMIARDEKYLEWPNSFTFDRMGNLTVLTNRLARFINHPELNLDEYNFRLISSHVGGNSYLYNENFDYQTHGEDHGSSSSTEHMHESDPNDEPSSEPEPEPEPGRHDHDHHMQDHNMTTESAKTSTDVKITPSAGSGLVVSLVLVLLGNFVVLA